MQKYNIPVKTPRPYTNPELIIDALKFTAVHIQKVINHAKSHSIIPDDKSDQSTEVFADMPDINRAERVLNIAKRLALYEFSRMTNFEYSHCLLIIELACCLYDVVAFKDPAASVSGTKMIMDYLASKDVDPENSSFILDIINRIVHEFLIHAGDTNMGTSPEMFIVQDAINIDHMGTTGIANAFNYGGSKKIPMHYPNYQYGSAAQQAECILGLIATKIHSLTDKMTTAAGKKAAQARAETMRRFMQSLANEWTGQDIGAVLDSNAGCDGFAD
jgi:uncharacterized protein